MTGRTEVVAVYIEEQIRSYGISVHAGLTLVSRSLPRASFGGVIASHEKCGSAPPLLVAMVHSDGQESLTLQMLLDEAAPQDPMALETAAWLPGDGPLLEHVHPVDALWFHGPHFGDRHGIAAAVLGALRRGAVPLICASFAGATVFLVLPAGQGDSAAAWLNACFVTPSGEGRR